MPQTLEQCRECYGLLVEVFLLKYRHTRPDKQVHTYYILSNTGRSVRSYGPRRHSYGMILTGIKKNTSILIPWTHSTNGQHTHKKTFISPCRCFCFDSYLLDILIKYVEIQSWHYKTCSCLICRVLYMYFIPFNIVFHAISCSHNLLHSIRADVSATSYIFIYLQHHLFRNLFPSAQSLAQQSMTPSLILLRENNFLRYI